LNPASQGAELEEGLDFQRIDSSRGDGQAQLAALQKLLASTGPKGATPLTSQVAKIRQRITQEGRDLARAGQKIVFVMATDGLPSGMYGRGGAEAQREFVDELWHLSSELPIHLVVRLCTDEDDIVDFYNGIDENLELQLEVIDDICAEAKECARVGNRWLTYSPIIHRLREGGTFLKLFDLLDERELEPMEVCLLSQYILREAVADRPVSTKPDEFLQQVQSRLPQLRSVFDPLLKKMVPPLIYKELDWALKPKSAMQRECGTQFCKTCLQQ